MSARGLAAFNVSYAAAAAGAQLQLPGTLALFEFGTAGATCADPRQVRVPLASLLPDPPHERWTVDATVTSGRDGGCRWSAGGGWRCTVVEVQATADGIEAASDAAYQRLLAHLAGTPEPHLQRIWNYLGAINEGVADAERYRLFCNGRARALAAHHVVNYPAATAIGHQGPRDLLQVYALSASVPGVALENPRQVSAWQYPRRYGPTAPSFARAMRLPGGALAISGTAAVVGHASHHRDDVGAQADEAFTNLASLLDGARLPRFDAHSPLKVYVRHPADAAAVAAALARHLDPAVPRVLLHGDVCRRELLVEIDGWRFAPATAATALPPR